MTMNHVDAQAFFDCSSKSFSQLKAIFVALETEAAKGGLSPQARDLTGAGLQIAESMSETVGCWADEAAEPWLEDSADQTKNEVCSCAENPLLNSEFIRYLCGIKALIDSAERAIWQEGDTASDRAMVMDAVYLLQEASSKVDKALSPASATDL